VNSGPRGAARNCERAPFAGWVVVRIVSSLNIPDCNPQPIQPRAFFRLAFTVLNQSLTGCRHVNREAGRKGMNAVAPGHAGAAPCSPEARRALTFWLVLAVPHRRLSKRGLAEVAEGRGRFIPGGWDSLCAAGQDARRASAESRRSLGASTLPKWPYTRLSPPVGGLGGSFGRRGGMCSASRFCCEPLAGKNKNPPRGKS
jgi:hypothetical protein